MALNPSIILSGQQVQPVNALAQGAAAGQQINDFRQTNAMRDMLQEQGPGIINGDQNALNALARFDPSAAQGIQSGRLNQQATQLGMENTRQIMAHRIQQEARELEAAAAQATSDQRAELARQIQAAVAMGMQVQTPEQWDALMAERNPDYVGMFDQREMLAAEYMSVADSLARMDERNAPEEVPTDPAAIQALKFRAEAAGLVEGTPEYQQFMLSGGKKDSELRIETTPDGRTVVTQGTASSTDQGRMDPSAPASMIDSIEGILNDPALDTSTGWLSFTQNIPGTPQYRFGTRSRQLEGQAFLQAFEGLKGAGQITEIEGTKATQAIGRLDTAQSPADYREALTDLLDILKAAQGRPEGWTASQAGTSEAATPPSVGDTMDGYRFKGGDPSQQSNWERI